MENQQTITFLRDPGQQIEPTFPHTCCQCDEPFICGKSGIHHNPYNLPLQCPRFHVLDNPRFANYVHIYLYNVVKRVAGDFNVAERYTSYTGPENSV